MKKLIVILLVAAVLGVSGWFGKSAYRNYKEKRFAARAQQFIEEKEYPKAALSARQALDINPNNITALGIMASLLEGGGAGQAVEWRKRIAELNPTVENQIILASCALRFEPAPFHTASSTLQNIAEKASSLPAFHVVSSQLALRRNDRALAEKHLTEAIRLDPKNEGNRLNLAAIQLQSQNRVAAAEARRTLLELRSNKEFGTEALRWLMRDAEGSGDEITALRFSKELLENKEAHVNDRYEHLALLRRIKSNEFSDYLTSLQTKAGTDPLDIYRLASWQTSSGMAAQSLEWMNSFPVTVQTNWPLPIARAEAMAGLDRWVQTSDYLREEKWGENDFIRRALLAQALLMQKEPDAAKANWSRAVEAASVNPTYLAALSQLAGKWKWESENEGVLWKIAQKFPEQAWALAMITQVYESNRNTAGLLRVYETRLRNNPADTLAKNNVASISMLLNTNMPASHLYAEQVFKADPKNWGYVSTYAYSLHLQGKTAEALKALQGLEQKDLERPNLALYLALFHNATGDTDQTRKYVALAEQNHFLPEEDRLLQEAKKSLKR